VSSAAITLCVTSQRVFIVVYFVIDSIRKCLDIRSYNLLEFCNDVCKTSGLTTQNFWTKFTVSTAERRCYNIKLLIRLYRLYSQRMCFISNSDYCNIPST